MCGAAVVRFESSGGISGRGTKDCIFVQILPHITKTTLKVYR
jgi:hypothetical protein